MLCQVYTTQSVAIWVLDSLTHLICAHVSWLVKVPLTFNFNKVNYLSVVFDDDVLPILDIIYLHRLVNLTIFKLHLDMFSETILYHLPYTKHMSKGGSSLSFYS